MFLYRAGWIKKPPPRSTETPERSLSTMAWEEAAAGYGTLRAGLGAISGVVFGLILFAIGAVIVSLTPTVPVTGRIREARCTRSEMPDTVMHQDREGRRDAETFFTYHCTLEIAYQLAGQSFTHTQVYPRSRQKYEAGQLFALHVYPAEPQRAFDSGSIPRGWGLALMGMSLLVALLPVLWYYFVSSDPATATAAGVVYGASDLVAFAHNG